MKDVILKQLSSDLRFINTQKGRSGFLATLKSLLAPSFICTFLYRCSHSLTCLRIPILPRLFWWVNFLLFKVDIDQRARLYCSLYMPHPMNIVIGSDTRIEGSVKIMQGTTIGGNLGEQQAVDGKTRTQPTISGRCFIGINAIVVGPISLTGNLFIGPNAIIAKSHQGDHWLSGKAEKVLSPAHLNELGISQ